MKDSNYEVVNGCSVCERRIGLRNVLVNLYMGNNVTLQNKKKCDPDNDPCILIAKLII